MEEEQFKANQKNIKPVNQSLQGREGIIKAQELLKILKESPKDSSGKNSTAIQSKITKSGIELLGISEIIED